MANLGSSVLGALAARTRAAYLLSTTARPDPTLSTGLTVPDVNLVPLGDALGLRIASRLGAGQRQHGVSVEMLANFVQAVLAAAYVQAGTVEALEARLPDVVADFLVEQGGRSSRHVPDPNVVSGSTVRSTADRPGTSSGMSSIR
jgi:hypothetical protein